MDATKQPIKLVKVTRKTNQIPHDAHEVEIEQETDNGDIQVF